VGNAVASFLLGTGSGGNVQLRANQDVQTWYMGAFVQDDYKVLRKLTLNLGGRLEYEAPRTDRYNRLNWLDLASPAGLTVPGVGALRGGLQFVGVNGNPRGQMDLTPVFSPRFGFAWQAQRATTVRGGYGIFLAPRYGGEFNLFGQIGFQATTTYVASINSLTPNAFLSNPFPNGFVLPTGSSQGMLTNIGADATSWERNSRAPYVQQWNFNVQRSVWANLVAEVAYAGSKGTHLPQTLEYNQLPDKYMSMGSELQRSVPNPFLRHHSGRPGRRQGHHHGGAVVAPLPAVH